MAVPQEIVTQINGADLHLVPTSKFKTVTITAKLKAPLNRETITKRALLPYILQQGTEDHPDRSSIQGKLDNLYGAVLSINGSKKGNHHIITFRLEVANQKFIPDAGGVLDEAIELLKQIIFHPKTENGGFPQTVTEREKDTLKQKINAVIDDKMSYANMRLIDEMCKNEAYQLHVQGYKDDLGGIDGKSLYDYYQSVLKEDHLDVYVLGDFDTDEVTGKIKSALERKTEQSKGKSEERGSAAKTEPQTVTDFQQLQQAKLHFGYRTNVTYGDEDYAALQVFNGLFGGFPSSKLFINVREKNSLAYYAASRVESHKGLLFVFSGIAPEDFEKAKNIIGEQMEAMQNGDFGEDEISNTKELIINQLLETMDNTGGVVELLYQQVVGETKRDPELLIKEINQVTKQEIIDVANKVTLDTIYLLTKEGSDENA